MKTTPFPIFQQPHLVFSQPGIYMNIAIVWLGNFCHLRCVYMLEVGIRYPIAMSSVRLVEQYERRG